MTVSGRRYWQEQYSKFIVTEDIPLPWFAEHHHPLPAVFLHWYDGPPPLYKIPWPHRLAFTYSLPTDIVLDRGAAAMRQ